LTNKYHTWCILADNKIQSNENNLYLTYLGTVRCGASGICIWDSLIQTRKDGQTWDISLETTGFTSLRETLTKSIRDPGYLVAHEDKTELKFTNKNDLTAQWIVMPAPVC